MVRLLAGILLVVCFWAQAQEYENNQDDSRHNLRIVALAPHIVESLYAIGAGHQIVGTTDFADYPEEAKAIPRIANYARIQIERVVELQPDIIIAWQTGNPPEDLARLKQFGFKVVYSHPTLLTDVAKELIMLGQLTGREESAQAVADAYLGQLSQLEQQYAHATPVSVFYALWSRPLRTVAKNAWPQQQLSLCGGANIVSDANEDYPQVSMESVLALNPQVIVQPAKGSKPPLDGINWQDYPTISAVENRFIFHPDSDKVHRMSTRMLYEITLLCEQLDSARHYYAP